MPKGNKAVDRKQSLAALAERMTEQRKTAERLLNDLRRLLFNENNGRVRWRSNNVVLLSYCDGDIISISVTLSDFTVKIISWETKQKKRKTLKDKGQLEDFLLKLYEGWRPKKGEDAEE